MTENTKINLSAKELELVCNTDWILTKQVIIGKVYELYGVLLPGFEAMLAEHKKQLPESLFVNSAKISKGENYRQLPWVMLDYPRCFGKTDTIAVRTFFWWGNFFSVSLQASGKYQSQLKTAVINQFEWLQQNDCWICINESEWEHHFEIDNYIGLKTMDIGKLEAIIRERSFIKIAARISVQQWTGVPAFIKKSFGVFTQLLQNH